MARARAAPILTLALACVLLPFYPSLFGDTALLAMDHALVFLPAKKIWLDTMLAEWAIPRWNYFFAGGMPYYADVSVGPLWPLNFLLLALAGLDFLRAYSVFVALHYAALYLAAYYLLRAFAPQRWATLFALPLAIGGGPVASAAEFMIVGACLGLYLFAGAWARFLRAGSTRDAVLAAGAWTLPLYAGEPQYSYTIAVFGFIWTLAGAARKRSWQPLAMFVGTGALAVCLAGPQLLPALEVVRDSVRSFSRIGLEGALQWSYHPVRFLELGLPLLFGDYPYGEAPWSRPYIFSFYAGAIVVIGAIFQASLVLRQGGRRLLWIAGLLFLGFVIQGRYGVVPLYEWLWQLVPLWKGFRYPERLTHFFLVLLVVGAMLGWRKAWRLPRSGLPLLSIAGGVTGMAATAAFLWGKGKIAMPIFPLVHGIVFTGVFLLLYGLRKRAPRAVFALLTLLALADFALVAEKVAFNVPASVARPENYPFLAQLLQDLERRVPELEAGGARRYASLGLFHGAPDYGPAAAAVGAVGSNVLGKFDNLMPNIPAYFGIESIDVNHSLRNRAPLELRRKYARDPQRLLDTMGVYYVSQRDQDGAVRKIARIPTALPYAFVSEAEKIAPLANTRVAVVARTGGSARFRIEATGKVEPGALFVWNEGFNSHWRPTVAGEPEPRELLHANEWAMGVALPALDSGLPLEIRFDYRDPSIQWGWALFAFGLLGAGAAVRRRA